VYNFTKKSVGCFVKVYKNGLICEKLLKICFTGCKMFEAMILNMING